MIGLIGHIGAVDQESEGFRGEDQHCMWTSQGALPLSRG